MTKSKKAIFGMLSMLLVAAVAVAGVVMWLTDKTKTIQNTFTVGDIEITLTESEDLDLKMIPGKTITKDPVVGVDAKSEACWLFVKVEESANFDTYMTYEIAEGWTELSGVAGVYYRSVDKTTAAAGTTFGVLKNNQVSVLKTVNSDQLAAAGTNAPTLSFTAYAVQSEGVDSAADAWAKVPTA